MNTQQESLPRRWRDISGGFKVSGIDKAYALDWSGLLD